MQSKTQTIEESKFKVIDFSTDPESVWVAFEEEGEEKQAEIPNDVVYDWMQFDDILIDVQDVFNPVSGHDQRIHLIDFVEYMEMYFDESDAAKLVKFCQMFNPEVFKS